ncbi:unnamed protein product [Triticum aestivum]|uniref:Integrase catalytic domain-containing protein n=1 Tax=Triticum aestivum TaxID=4565 RepID=A0A7H4LH01_WHEAT|nr:unnamed protein product [Triticum aestivum]
MAIVVERKEAGKEYPVQRLVYYISEVHIESKQRYPHWQKLVYGVFMAGRKRKQYFHAEYEALLHGLRMAKEMNLSRVKCFGDSDLVAQQVFGTWDSKDPLMAAYCREVDIVAGHFKGYQVDHVDRRKNEAADALSRLGSQRKPVPPNVFLDVLHNPSVKLPTEEDLAVPDPEAQLVAALHVIPDWTVPYFAYMNRGELPEDETLARQIIRRSKSMAIVNGDLHHCSVTRAFQRCVSPEEGREILRDHAGSKSLVAKAFRHGFYWLTAHADAQDLVKKCDGCQKFSRRAHVLAQELRMVPITWPFATWELDMVGPFKRSKDKKTHLLVTVDKFTKWVEAEPVSKCDAATAVQFIKKVIFQFGFPHSIITDNGTNLSKGAMKEFCQREHIRLDVSSVAHPQSNGQAERASQEILKGIKPRLMVPLQRTPSCWVEELPSVLWSINTTPNRSTGYTLFMVYGAEAVLPSDIRHDSPRVAAYVEADKEKA